MDIYPNNSSNNGKIISNNNSKKKQSKRRYLAPLICLSIVIVVVLLLFFNSPSRLEKRQDRLWDKYSYTISEKQQDKLLEKIGDLNYRKSKSEVFFEKYQQKMAGIQDFFENTKEITHEKAQNRKYKHAQSLIKKNKFEKAAQILTELVEENCKYAKPLLGELYYNGTGVNKDIKTAISLFDRSHSDMISCKYLGDYYKDEEKLPLIACDYYSNYIRLGGMERFSQYAMCLTICGGGKDECLDYANKGISSYNKEAQSIYEEISNHYDLNENVAVCINQGDFKQANALINDLISKNITYRQIARDYNLTPLGCFIYLQFRFKKGFDNGVQVYSNSIKDFHYLMDILQMCKSVGLTFDSIPAFISQMGYTNSKRKISSDFARYVYDTISEEYNMTQSFNEVYTLIHQKEKAEKCFTYFAKVKGEETEMTFEQFFETILCYK